MAEAACGLVRSQDDDRVVELFERLERLRERRRGDNTRGGSMAERLTYAMFLWIRAY